MRVGIVAGDGGAVDLAARGRAGRAKQYLLTGDAVGAAEAERLGLVNEVVPAAELTERAMAWAAPAGRRARRSPCSYTKQAVNEQVKRALPRASISRPRSSW